MYPAHTEFAFTLICPEAETDAVLSLEGLNTDMFLLQIRMSFQRRHDVFPS